MSASSIPAVRDRLVTLLKASLAEAGDRQTQVTYGHPGKNLPARYIAVCDSDEAGARREQRTFPLRRTSSRTEDYQLRVVIWNLVGNHSDQRTPTLATWALADLLDDLCRANHTLKSGPTANDGLVDWALCTGFSDADFLLAEGRASEIVVSVSVHVTRA